MAKQIINIGSSEQAGDGESLRSAFDKINDNFDELYLKDTTDFDGQFSSLAGTPTTLAGYGITDAATTAQGALAATAVQPQTSLSGYGITDAYTKAEVDSEIATATSSLTIQSGSTHSIDIVAADSTLLVDSVNGTLNATTLTGALPAIDGSALTSVTTAFSNITSTPTTLAGYGITDAQDALVSGTSIKTVNGQSLLGSGNIVISGGSGGGGGSSFTNIGVGADDSTIRSISEGESFLILGGTGITTASDAEGNITITGVAQDFAFSSLTGTPTTISGYGITDALTAGGALTGSSLEAEAVGAGVVDGNDLTITGGDATELNSTGGDTNITGGSGALASGNVNIGATQTVLVSIGSSGTNVDFPSGTQVDFTGATITGLDSSGLTKPIKWLDSEIAIFGDDDDLQIFHTGTSGIIQNATGQLQLRGNTIRLLNAATTEDFAYFNNNGSVDLYYDGVKKFETSTDGVAVTGKITGLTDPTAAQDAATKAYVDANSGGSGLQTRGSVTGTTSSLADAAEADLDITGFKSYALLTITTDRAARVRLYVNAATRTADASRAEGVDPTSDAGLIAEVITTGAETVIISPGAYGFNLESSPTTNIPCRVTNKSGGTSTVQVDLNILQLEA